MDDDGLVGFAAGPESSGAGSEAAIVMASSLASALLAAA